MMVGSRVLVASINPTCSVPEIRNLWVQDRSARKTTPLHCRSLDQRAFLYYHLRAHDVSYFFTGLTYYRPNLNQHNSKTLYGLGYSLRL